MKYILHGHQLEPISKDIQISSNYFHIITKTQFPIQLVATRTIHQTPGLTLDYLKFGLTNVYKHGLIYITFSSVKKNEIFYLLQPLRMNFFQIDPSVAMEMCQLQTIAQWDVLVPKPYTFHDSHVLIYFLNTRSLSLYKNDVSLYYNLKTTHILCLNETNFNTLMFNDTSLNIDTTHSMTSVNGQNDAMIIYDNFTTLSSHETFTSLGVEYIATTFNANTRKIIHIITIYKPSTLSVSMFIIHLQVSFESNANFWSHDNN